MRLNLTCFLCILLTISCTRSNQTTPPVTLALPLLDSFKNYTLGPKEITLSTGKMIYDESGRLTHIYGTTTDTGEDGHPLRSDTLDFTLIYNGADSLPMAYTNLEYNFAFNEVFGFLSYDDQGRVSQDSGYNGNVNWIRKYRYNEKQIIQYYGNYADTIVIGDNNVLSRTENMVIHSYTYSAYPNPFYQPALANHIGAFMIFNHGDIFSKNLYNSSQSWFRNYDPYLAMNFSWTTNSTGQVTSGIATDAKTGAILQYLWFTYR